MSELSGEQENPFAAPQNDSGREDDTFSPRTGRYQVLGFLCVAAAIAYVQRAAISVPAAEIASDLRITNLARDMGWVLSVWYFSYALMQLPSGWFADRVGSRRALTIMCIVWSSATLLSGFATGFVSLMFLWGLMGAAQAGAFPCAAKAIGQIFPETERAGAAGLLASGMAIGGAIAPFMTVTLLVILSPIAATWNIDRWRLLLASYAIPGIVWAIAFWMLVPASRLPATLRPNEIPAPVNWSRMLRSGTLALLCAQQFFRAAGMVFFFTWFPKFLQETRGVSILASGVLTAIAGVGSVIGSLSGGFFSDWMFRRTGNARLSRQGIAVAGMASCSALIVASYFIADVRSSIAVISLGAFCATFGGVSGYTVAIGFGGRHVATVFSSMNMCGNFGAALFPITAGWLVEQTGNWNLMLFLFAGIMAVDAVCWAFLNPRGTLFGDSHETH